MTAPTSPWNIPLFAPGDTIPSLEGVLNSISTGLNTALNTAVVGAYIRSATLAGLTTTGLAVGQHATVYADSTASKNGDYIWSGSAWLQFGVTAVNVTTFGSGWSATNSTTHQPRLRMLGNQVFLYGGVTTTGVQVASVMTIPSAYQPPSTGTRFIGTGISSNGIGIGWAMSAGVVSIPSGYSTGGLGAATVPLICSWWMD